MVPSISHQIKPWDQEHGDNSGNSHLDEASCFDPYLFLRNLPNLPDGGNALLYALFPEETTKRKLVTLVLDLDGTHSLCTKKALPQDVFGRVAEMFEIIFFTVSQSIYAKQLLDKLDPDNTLFSRRAYRYSCIFSDGNHTKDLTVLGVDLAKVAIVDNSPQVIQLQVYNGIPIESWFDDPTDSALAILLPFLETLVDDVRPIIAKKYGVEE